MAMARRSGNILLGAYLIGLAGGVLSFGAERRCWIESMVGDVKIRREGSVKWLNARVKLPVKQKDAIRTFVESEAVIATSEGTKLRVSENSTVELATFVQGRKGDNKTNVKILSGDVMSNVKKLVSKGSSFQFETPTAVASIRGTRVGFRVSGSQTDILVYEGRVYVTPKGSRTGAELTSNQMTSVVEGQKSVTVSALDTSTATESDTTDTSSASDTSGPEILLNSPDDGQVAWPGVEIVVSGRVDPPGARVTANGRPVNVSPRGTFRVSLTAPLEEGEHVLTVEATIAGQSGSESRTIVVEPAPSSLVLSVATPNDGSLVSAPVIPVSGMVTPGAVLTVSNIEVPVSVNGSFAKDIHIPAEEGVVTIEFEATLGDERKYESRTVEYRSLETGISLIIEQPVDRALVCDSRVPVAGRIRPDDAELFANDKRIPARNGRFSDFAMIPQEPGEHEIEFEVSTEENSRTFRRSVRYDPAQESRCNVDPPMIQPGSLPYSTLQRRLSFTVFDRTPHDEITFYTVVDGSRDSETGPSGGQFFMDLEEGSHEYRVYAEDLGGNKSSVVAGRVRYMPKTLYVRVRKPGGYEVVRVPPGTPDGEFDRPEYTVDFVVENVPDDDPQLLREVKVVNQATGQTVTERDFTEVDFDFDVELTRGKNPILIEVRDVSDRIATQQATIELR
ncbi:MAG: hypothetical protein GF418_01840 [Chitinivibrionales bacterium]|nr:hypothetical protein [Chitinivibrionales bacterium]MBD3394341.1 hypothetical protein [Chitinivibrionales bacterium]